MVGPFHHHQCSAILYAVGLCCFLAWRAGGFCRLLNNAQRARPFQSRCWEVWGVCGRTLRRRHRHTHAHACACSRGVDLYCRTSQLLGPRPKYEPHPSSETWQRLLAAECKHGSAQLGRLWGPRHGIMALVYSRALDDRQSANTRTTTPTPMPLPTSTPLCITK